MSSRTCSSCGFSLIELLVVVAILSLLAVALIPAISDIAASQRRTKFLTDISILFENARQQAIAKNTYVWVAFSESSANEPLYAIVVASKSGLAEGYGPDDVWSSRQINLQTSADFTPISRIVNLGNYAINASSSTPLSTMPSFRANTPAITLTRSVQFSPSGEARVGPGVQANLAMEAKPSVAGSQAHVIDQITINGPTGFVEFSSGS